MMESASNCKIKGLRIEGMMQTYQNSSNYGIYITGGDNITISENTFNNNAIGINQGLSNADYNNIFSKNTCKNNVIGISLSSSNGDSITNNICSKNSNNGIVLNSCENIVITGNTCNKNTNAGIVLNAGKNNVITGNTCNHNNTSGIKLNGSKYNSITGNTCNAAQRGIEIFFDSNNNVITGNICKENTSVGIMFSSSENNNVTGNSIGNIYENPPANVDPHSIAIDINSSYNSITNNNLMGYVYPGIGKRIQYNNVMQANNTITAITVGTGNTLAFNKSE